MQVGQKVTLVRMERPDKTKPPASVEYDGIVVHVDHVNSKADDSGPKLEIAFLDGARSAVLGGVNWRDAFDRCVGVPHEDDAENEPFYYREAHDAADLIEHNYTLKAENAAQREVLEQQASQLTGLQADLKAAQAQYAQSTEGKDEALQSQADETARFCRKCGSYDKAKPHFILNEGIPTADTVYTPENSHLCQNAFHQ